MSEPTVFEFSPDGKSARLVVTAPDGRKWFVSMTSETAWRTDHRLYITREAAHYNGEPHWKCSACGRVWAEDEKPGINSECHGMAGAIGLNKNGESNVQG